MAADTLSSSSGPQPTDLAIALRSLLRSGLPVTPSAAKPELLQLSGVQARASDPSSRLSRAKALDGLLRWQLSIFENQDLSSAAQLLFGYGREAAGATLTRRRELASRSCGYELHHFRKRIEPKILDQLAWQLHRDSQEYIPRSRAAAPKLVAAGKQREFLPTDVFAWEVIEHQEWWAQLWSLIYSLRAQLLRIDRLLSMKLSGGQAPSDLDDAVITTAWYTALLLRTALDYQATYGDKVLEQDTQLKPTELIRLAGWLPPLSTAEVDILAGCVGRLEDGVEPFIHRLHSSPGGSPLLDRWKYHLMDETTVEQRDEGVSGTRIVRKT